MLDVRRTTVTTVASNVQAAGAISYSRGVIKIIYLQALNAMAYECYETLREQTSSARQWRSGRRRAGYLLRPLRPLTSRCTRI
jgi:hypothetical protein